MRLILSNLTGNYLVLWNHYFFTNPNPLWLSFFVVFLASGFALWHTHCISLLCKPHKLAQLSSTYRCLPRISILRTWNVRLEHGLSGRDGQTPSDWRKQISSSRYGSQPSRAPGSGIGTCPRLYHRFWCAHAGYYLSLSSHYYCDLFEPNLARWGNRDLAPGSNGRCSAWQNPTLL
jgi:hypothetical protein